MNRNKHIRIWERTNGKKPFGHHIHHIDGNHSNNDLENLICVSPTLHHGIHLQQYQEHGKAKDAIAANRLAKVLEKPIVKGYHSGEDNPMYGVEPVNKGKTGLQVGFWKGKKMPEEAKQAMRDGWKRRREEKVTNEN